MSPLDRLLRAQSGLVTRSQAVEEGLVDTDLERMMRRRELVRVHRGVYVDHTGELTWEQRAWAAVLATWPAVLTGHSAVRTALGVKPRHDHRTIHVLVAVERTLKPPEGVVVTRTRRFDDVARLTADPPRVRLEEAVLECALSHDRRLDALAELADAIGAGKTTTSRLSAGLALRTRSTGRAWLAAVLDDWEHGTCSVLEHGYLTEVERAHGLPVGSRQARVVLEGKVAYRDVLYTAYGLAVELDGRLHHDSAEARDADLDRDLAAAVSGVGTLRLGWGQVFDRPCATARQVATLLRNRGWDRIARPCVSEVCAVR